MTIDEIKQGVIDILIRKNLMDETIIIELLELLGEDKFYDFVFKMSGQTLKMPSADRIWMEYRNELIGRTLDETDNRFVRRELKERWSLTSANLSMIYKKYKKDVETGEYSAEMKSHEHLIEGIKKRRRKGKISIKRAFKDITTFSQFKAQHRQDLNFCLEMIAVNYPESLDSNRNDIFAKALRRIRKQIKDSEEAKIRQQVRNENGFFKEK
jgi:ribosomal protein S21